MHLHLSGEQVSNCGRIAAIRHVKHVDPGHHFEQLAAEMLLGPDAGRRKVDFAGVSHGIVDELGDRFGRERGIYLRSIGPVARMRSALTHRKGGTAN
jgi:hypothetical protein